MTLSSRLRPLGLAAAAVALLASSAMAAPVTPKWGTSYDNTLKGTNVRDHIEGRDGHDEIWGFGGGDRLFGNDGDDVLDGGSGDDVIYGDGNCTDSTVDDETHDECTYATGSDVITGGLGADFLSGNSGADVYVYTSVEDSPPGKGASDQLYLYPTEGTPVHDFIDLRRIDANEKKAGRQHFIFIGKKPFSRTPGELRVSDNNVLMGDTTGSGTPNFAIQLKIEFAKPYTGEGLLLK